MQDELNELKKLVLTAALMTISATPLLMRPHRESARLVVKKNSHK
jgi:hypothetical protein